MDDITPTTDSETALNPEEIIGRIQLFEKENALIFKSGKYISGQTKKRVLEIYRPCFKLLSNPKFFEEIKPEFDTYAW